MAALEPPAMSVADRSLGCVQVRGPKLDRARTKDKGRGDPAAIRYSARGDDRNGYRIDASPLEPSRLFRTRGVADHDRVRRSHSIQQERVRKAEVKADDLGPDLF